MRLSSLRAEGDDTADERGWHTNDEQTTKRREAASSPNLIHQALKTRPYINVFSSALINNFVAPYRSRKLTVWPVRIIDATAFRRLTHANRDCWFGQRGQPWPVPRAANRSWLAI